MEERCAAEQAQRQKQQGEKRQEHIKRNCLAEGYAVRENTPARANQLSHYGFHWRPAGLYEKSLKTHALFNACCAMERTLGECSLPKPKTTCKLHILFSNYEPIAISNRRRSWAPAPSKWNQRR